MIFDKYGLPRDNGASDSMDSCRLAAMMAVIGHPKAPNMLSYVTLGLWEGVRHPFESPANNPLNFTRDQLIPLVVGLHALRSKGIALDWLYRDAKARGWRAQNVEKDLLGSNKTWPDGADWLSPFNRLVMAKAANIPGHEAIGRAWAVMDVLFNAVFTPTRESNQLLCSLHMLGPKWVRFYKRVTPKWKTALREYWGGWRGEAEFGEQIVTFFDQI